LDAVPVFVAFHAVSRYHCDVYGFSGLGFVDERRFFIFQGVVCVLPSNHNAFGNAVAVAVIDFEEIDPGIVGRDNNGVVGCCFY